MSSGLSTIVPARPIAIAIVIAIAAVLAAMALTAAAQAATAGPSKATPARGNFSGQVAIGNGRKLYLRCKGRGSPAVILESATRPTPGR
jgi:hypothetical protein